MRRNLLTNSFLLTVSKERSSSSHLLQSRKRGGDDIKTIALPKSLSCFHLVSPSPASDHSFITASPFTSHVVVRLASLFRLRPKIEVPIIWKVGEIIRAIDDFVGDG
jgi:hypothetical protein